MTTSWRTDDLCGGVLKEIEDFGPRFPTCMNCGEARREVNELGGWCAECSGEKPIISEEEQRERYAQAHAAIMWRAAQSPRWLAQKAEAERLWAEYLARKKAYRDSKHAVPAFAKGR